MSNRSRRGAWAAAVLALALSVVAVVCVLLLSSSWSLPLSAMSNGEGLSSQGANPRFRRSGKAVANKLEGRVQVKSIIHDAVRAAVKGAEKEVKTEIKSDVKDAVKEAIEEAVAGSQALSQNKDENAFVNALVKDSAREAARAGAEEVRQYGREIGHITKELDSQLGGLLEGGNMKKGFNEKTMTSSSWIDLATKMLKSQKESDAETSHRSTRAEAERQQQAHKLFVKEEKSIQEQATNVNAHRGNIPIGSRKNPLYVEAEHDRDTEAEKDFKVLEQQQKAKEVLKHVKARLHHESRTEMANKYLKIMDKKVLPSPRRHVSVDRNALAQRYLKQLEVQQGPGDHSHRTVIQDKKPLSREQQAKLDMEFLRRGDALVEHGDVLKPVKLNPAIVHGDNKLEKAAKLMEEEKEEQRLSNHDRNELAQSFLKQLKHGHYVGKPFHALKVPAQPHKAPDMDAKAQKYLKQLQAANPHVHADAARQTKDRSAIAERDLHQLETSKGH